MALSDTAKSPHHLPLLFLLVSAVVFLLQLPFLFQGEEYVVGTLTNDDTYYYLQTAWNTARTGICSFDGITPTNGVQMLWFWILTGAARLVSSKSLLLSLCLGLCFALNAYSAGLVFWVFRSSKSRYLLPLIMTTLWCAILVKGTYWLGLENSLHAATGWTIVLLALQWHRAEGKRGRILWGLLVLLILNTYIRLDSAIISAVIFGWFGILAVIHGHGKRLPFMLIVGAAAALALFGGYYLMGGTWIPISGMVKQHWGQAEGSPGLFAMIATSFPDLLPYSLSATRFIWIVVALLFLTFAGICFAQWRSRSISPLSQIVLLLIVGNLAYLSIFHFGNISYDLYYRWYKSWQHIMWLLLIGEIVLFLYVKASQPKVPRTIACVVVLILIGLLTLRQAYYKFHFPYREYTWHQRYLAAKWINRNMPPAIIIGSWNAGQLGYFSGRTVINLDGLINGRTYYETVITGEVPLSHYLNDRGVTHLFDYPSGTRPGDVNLQALPVEKEFPRSEFGVFGESMFLWEWIPNDYSGDDGSYLIPALGT